MSADANVPVITQEEEVLYKSRYNPDNLLDVCFIYWLWLVIELFLFRDTGRIDLCTELLATSMILDRIPLKHHQHAFIVKNRGRAKKEDWYCIITNTVRSSVEVLLDSSIWKMGPFTMFSLYHALITSFMTIVLCRLFVQSLVVLIVRLYFFLFNVKLKKKMIQCPKF